MGVLSVKDLKTYYKTDIYGVSRTVRAVDGISLEIHENEIFGIAGESSCGKTTLIKALSGTITPPLTVVDGEVLYNFGNESIDILSLRKDELKKISWERISYILQGSMSVLNPVRKIHKTFHDFFEAHRKIENQQEFMKQMRDHLGKLGLPGEVLKAYPHHLSGGMRQRVTIALATIFKPNVIIADEPTTALDVVVQRGVLQLLKEIQQEQKNTVILVTHDMAVHANIADRVGIMYAGRIVEDAQVDDIFEDPLHPYTKHLIGSLPMIGDKSYKGSIPGAPPNLADPPNGCRFHPRCPHIMGGICREEVPPMVNVESDRGPRRVACFLVSKEGDNGK
jgi:peptide/nickel transport system ATP-binding protein